MQNFSQQTIGGLTISADGLENNRYKVKVSTKNELCAVVCVQILEESDFDEDNSLSRHFGNPLMYQITHQIVNIESIKIDKKYEKKTVKYQYKKVNFRGLIYALMVDYFVNEGMQMFLADACNYIDAYSISSSGFKIIDRPQTNSEPSRTFMNFGFVANNKMANLYFSALQQNILDGNDVRNFLNKHLVAA